MVILHICSVENKMSNGATVAALNHINEQAKSRQVKILACHVKDEVLPWDDAVQVVKFDDLRDRIREVDLVVFHEIYYPPFFQIAKWLQRDKVPYVVVAHGGMTKGAQSQRKYPKMVVNFLWAKHFITAARAVHFLSEKEQSTSVQWNHHYMISPNGVHIPEKYKENWNSRKDGLRLIYIGRINLFYKGLDVLCQACGRIREQMQRQNIKICIYGPKEGEDYQNLLQLIEQNQIQDLLEVREGVFGEDKIKAMLEADAFIQPSRSEGQPMGILEAMAAGLPAVVTPGTSFDRLVSQENCGWVTECEPDKLADTILRVYEERDSLREKSKLARDMVTEQFCWEKVATETIKKYEHLLEM